jgi:hypothetical protein
MFLYLVAELLTCAGSAALRLRFKEQREAPSRGVWKFPALFITLISSPSTASSLSLIDLPSHGHLTDSKSGAIHSRISTAPLPREFLASSRVSSRQDKL